MRSGVIALILVAVSYFGVAAELEWQTVEEVLAVVGSTPLLLSDVDLAALVRLVDAAPDEAADDYRSRLLDARIRLEIEFRDIEDGGLLFRLELDPQRARQLLVERGGGEARLDREFEARGLVISDLDELVLRVAAVDAFVQQRLRPRISVNMDEIEAAYQQLLVDEIATSDEPIPPLAMVRDQLYELLVERKLNDGRQFKVVKVFHEPEELQARLVKMGWAASIRATAQFFIYGWRTRSRNRFFPSSLLTVDNSPKSV